MIRAEGDKEIQSLNEFRNRVEDLTQTDVVCLRFLRGRLSVCVISEYLAREGNLDKAEDLLRKCLKWREEIQVANYLTWRLPTCIADDSILFEHTGIDTEGRPVLWLPFGRFKVREWIQKGYKEDLVKFRYHFFETSRYHIEQSKADQAVYILGMEGLTYWNIANVETIQLLIESLNDLIVYYPETVKSIYIVNTSWIFSYIMTWVKPLLSARTAKKITIFNSDKKKWLPMLLESVPKSCIPREYLDEKQ